MSGIGNVKVGLVGCGNWGRHILRDLVAGGGAVTVVARSAESIARARDGGAAAIVGSHHDLSGDLDGFVVATPTNLHLPVVEDLLPHGKPLFVEKPLGNDVARAGRLPPSAQSLVFTMQKWRYHPGIVEMARLARERDFGELKAIRSVRLAWGNPHAGVDTIWHLIPHDLAIALEIFGTLPPLMTAFSDPLGKPGQGVMALLGEDRPQALIEVSSRHPTYRRSVIASFDDATVELADGWSDTVSISRAGNPKPERRFIGNELPLAREINAFLDHLRGGPPPKTALVEESVILQRIAEIRAAAGLDALGLTDEGS